MINGDAETPKQLGRAPLQTQYHQLLMFQAFR